MCVRYRSALTHQWNPWRIPVSHLYCLVQLTGGCMTPVQESAGPTFMYTSVPLPHHNRRSPCVLLRLQLEVLVSWLWANVSLLVLPQSPLIGWYMSLKKLSNPQPLLASFNSRTRFLFHLLPTGYHQRLHSPKFTIENSSLAFSPRAYGTRLKESAGLLLEQGGQPSCERCIEVTAKFSDWRWLGMCCPGNPNSASAALLLVSGSVSEFFLTLRISSLSSAHLTPRN